MNMRTDVEATHYGHALSTPSSSAAAASASACIRASASYVLEPIGSQPNTCRPRKGEAAVHGRG